MKINFTKTEYQLLVTMIEIADWVMNAHHAPDRKDTEDYQALRNKILSFVDEMGMKGCYVKEGDSYYETPEFEENSKQTGFIDEYDEDTFWDQLITRLINRDYDKQFGNEKVDFETKVHRLTEMEKRYTDEVNEFGILNVEVKMKSSKTVH